MFLFNKINCILPSYSRVRSIECIQRSLDDTFIEEFRFLCRRHSTLREVYQEQADSALALYKYFLKLKISKLEGECNNDMDDDLRNTTLNFYRELDIIISYLDFKLRSYRDRQRNLQGI